jgi:hypothetical protein
MNRPPPTVAEAGRHPARPWLVAGVILVLVAGGCLWAGLRGHEVPLAPPVASKSVPPTVIKRTSSKPLTIPVVARSIPVALSVPAIGLWVGLSTLGLNPDGTVQVPTDIQQPGWYRLGPTPGQVGSAVILGHVDSYQGPAVFFELRTLQVGDVVHVMLADDVVVNFSVTAVAMYLKDQFPDQLVYGPHGNSALQLVTCGGTFDSQTGHYLSNVVVYTSLVSFGKIGSPPTSVA